VKRLRFSLIFLLCLWLLVALRPAFAHGYIVRSTPPDRAVLTRPPNQVQIWFSEGIERRFSSIAVFDQTGQQVDNGDGRVDERNAAKLVVSLPSDLPPGAYLVKLRPVFISDGHAVSDTLVFWIGDGSGQVAVEDATTAANFLEALWRVLLTLALIVFLGTVATYALVLRPVWGTPLPLHLMRRSWGMLWGSLLLANVVNVLALLQVAATLFETNIAAVLRDELWNIALAGTNFGDVWGYRAALLAGMLFIQIIAVQQARNRPHSTYILWLVNGGLALLALGTLSMISHAAGLPFWGSLSVLVDYIHLAAVAFWVGGLVVLALLLRPMLEPLPVAERGRVLLALLKRFSPLALVAVSLIISTGIYSASRHLSTPSDIPNTTYGLTLLLKWGLMLPLFGLGAVHFWVLDPQRRARFSRAFPLPTSLRLEMLAALLVLIAAAWLPATPPPVPADARIQIIPPAQTVLIGEYTVTLTVNPGAVGTNAYDVQIDPPLIESARLRFFDPERAVYTAPLFLDASDAGYFVGASGEIDAAGIWHASIDLSPPDAPPLRAAFRWSFAAEANDGARRSPSIMQGLALSLVILVGAGWFFPLLRRLDWTPATVALALLSGGAVLFVIVGGYLLFEGDSEQAARLEPTNPIFADQEALQAGRRLYQTECLLCHGEDGRGQTPTAINLNRPMPDLTVILPTRDDADLYRILSRGLAANRHSFGQQLLADERWQLIHFLRFLE